MAIQIPFNFQPVSTSIKTSSYTIPSGQFAYVVAYVENGGTFTIDGVTSIDSNAAVAADYNTIILDSTINGTFYTVPSGYRFEGTAQANVGFKIDGNTRTTGSSELQVSLGSGSTLATRSTSDYYLYGAEIKEAEPETNATENFWLPTGTVINGTGTWRATVSLYNEIT